MTAHIIAREKYYLLLDDMACLIAKARNDDTGFASSAIALLNLERQVRPAIHALSGWELSETTKRNQEKQMQDVAVPKPSGEG